MEPDLLGHHGHVPPCIPPACNPIGPPGAAEEISAYEKFCRCLKIIVSVFLIIGLSIYFSDNYYNSLSTDLNTLKKHIEHMQNDLHSATEKKADVDKQISDIASALPALKEMADTVLEDINSGKNIKKRDDKLTDYLRNVVKQELEQYNADKTGKTDFALESSGGLVISTRKTESYMGAGPSLSLFGIPLCQSTNNPTSLIQPGVMPGECWAIKGATGSAVIQLIDKIYVTGVSVEHIHRSISPSGETSTAPKKFSILGLQSEEDTDGFFFGEFNYDVEGPTLQYFPVQHQSPRMFDIIEFRILSNHGNAEYTCIYRLRVHGDLKH